jgi:uncharacterized protein
MNIQQEVSGAKGAFFIREKDTRLAEMTFFLNGAGVLTILHTEVDESLRGKNIGYILLKETAAYAHKNQFKIIAHCSFAKAMLEKKKEEFANVL